MKINLLKTNKLFLAGVIIAIVTILGFSIFGLVKAINNKKAKVAINMQNEIDDETHIEEGIEQEEEIDINELEEYVPEEENNTVENNNTSSNSSGTSNTNSNKTTSSGKKYYIKVNNGANVVTVYTQDENGEYTVPVKAMVCSTGTATPQSGEYTIKSRWEWLGLFGNVYGHYSTQIVGNILFHSVPYLEKGNPGSLEYWEYDKLGTSASMGCIRLTVRDARWIFNNVSSGTIVEFYSSSNPGPLGKPSAQKISGNVTCRNWDPTDSNPNNPWNSYKEEKPKEDDKNNNVNQNTNTTNTVNNNAVVNNAITNNATNNAVTNNEITNNSVANNNINNNIDNNKVNNTANNINGNNITTGNNVSNNNTANNNSLTNNTTNGNNTPNKNTIVNNVVNNTTNNNLSENNTAVNNTTTNNIKEDNKK